MVLMGLPLQGALKNRICFFFVIFLCLNYLFDQIFNNSKISSFFFKYSQRGVTSKGVKENMYGLQYMDGVTTGVLLPPWPEKTLLTLTMK